MVAYLTGSPGRGAATAVHGPGVAGVARAGDEVTTRASAGPAVRSEPRHGPRPTRPSAGAPALVAAATGLPAVTSAVASAVAACDGPVGLDTETTGLDHSRDRVRLLQLATPRGRTG